MDKQHILAEAVETGLFQFKEQVLFKCKNNIPVVQCKRKTFPLILLSTQVSFRWTVPVSHRNRFFAI
jgi:hypothetical protein